ncbi:MAG TPA: hypothetical protein VHT91_46110 [Kofleriaceae bacterium]|jgi:hypothetical protein|nr:hypothetical protein [Kofleriaceae bacterium]
MATHLERALATRRALAIAIGLSLAVAATSISIGFLTDDHGFRAVLRSENPHAPAAYDLFRFIPGDPAGNQLRIRTGRLPWWAAPDLRIHFLRPLTGLAFAADDRLFGGDPLGYHLVSLAWYAALLIAAAALFRRLLPAAAATLAVAVLGLSAAHVDAYAWISARHVAIAGALAAAALALQVSRRGRGLAPVALAIALAASEAALAAVPLSIALALTDRTRTWRQRWLACAPAVGLAAAYLAVYAALGCGTRGSGGYHDPAADPLGFAALAAVRVPLLLGDAALGIPAELAHVVAEWKLALLGALAVGVVALAWWLTSPAAPSGAASRPRADPPAPATDRAPGGTVLWLAAGGIAGTLVGAAGFPSGRVLVIPDLAFAAVIGLVLHRGLAAGWPGRILASLLAIVHLGIAPLQTVAAVDKLAGRARATEAIAGRIAELAPPSGRVFLVAASDPMVFLYPRAILADQAPGTVRCWSVLSAARSGHRLTRTGARSLAIDALDRPLLDGSFDTLYRSDDRPFAIGDTVEQCGATIRVAALRDGRPSRLEVALRRSLDDPELGWLVWRDHRLERLAMPRVGETVELPWSAGPSRVL